MTTLAAALRLDEHDNETVRRCLNAVANDRFDFGEDYHSVIGAWPDEVCRVATDWPVVAVNKANFMIVNNCLANIWGYPHGKEHEVHDLIGESCEAVGAALKRLRFAARGTFLPADQKTRSSAVRG